MNEDLSNFMAAHEKAEALQLAANTASQAAAKLQFQAESPLRSHLIWHPSLACRVTR